jgi:hypothetical protein
MKKYAAGAAAAAISIFISHSAAQAVDVEYYKASVEFSREIGTCYEHAPSALKARMLGARVIVVADNKVMGQVQRATNAPKSDIAKFSKPSVSGKQFVAVAYRGLIGTQPRSIIFNEATLGTDRSSYRCHAVVHEMMHLLDMGPSSRNPSYSAAISHRQEFLAAFKADKKDYEAWLAWLQQNHPEEVAMVRSRLIYFFSDPMEAFAEAGANLVSPLPDSEFNGRNHDHKYAMKRINAYVEAVLTQAGVLSPKVSETVPYVSPAQAVYNGERPVQESVAVKQNRVWPSQQHKRDHSITEE